MEIIIRPIVTEKSMQSTSDGKFIFEASPNTNKIEITKELEKLYKVNVLDVNIINAKGKTKTFKRIQGKRKDVKKAIVTLKQGQKIPGFEMEVKQEKEEAKK